MIEPLDAPLVDPIVVSKLNEIIAVLNEAERNGGSASAPLAALVDQDPGRFAELITVMPGANAKVAVLSPAIRDLAETRGRLEAAGIVVVVARPTEVKFDTETNDV